MSVRDDPKWVVFDLGETLVDESRNWGKWADYIGVPRLTFFAVFGAVIAAGRPHTDAFTYFRPGFLLREEVPRKAAAGLPWGFDADDLYDDALPALASLHEAGLRLAVMANQPLEAVPFLGRCPLTGSPSRRSGGLRSQIQPSSVASVTNSLCPLGASPTSGTASTTMLCLRTTAA
jgi:hypothetical protein